jgi:hypothetical protein
MDHGRTKHSNHVTGFWSVMTGHESSKVVLINMSLDPAQRPETTRIYAPYQQQHDNDKGFPFTATLQPYNPKDSLSATSLSLSGWTCHGSTNVKRKGTFDASNVCQPQLDATAGLYFCETLCRMPQS